MDVLRDSSGARSQMNSVPSCAHGTVADAHQGNVKLMTVIGISSLDRSMCVLSVSARARVLTPTNDMGHHVSRWETWIHNSVGKPWYIRFYSPYSVCMSVRRPYSNTKYHTETIRLEPRGMRELPGSGEPAGRKYGNQHLVLIVPG